MSRAYIARDSYLGMQAGSQAAGRGQLARAARACEQQFRHLDVASNEQNDLSDVEWVRWSSSSWTNQRGWPNRQLHHHGRPPGPPLGGASEPRAAARVLHAAEQSSIMPIGTRYEPMEYRIGNGSQLDSDAAAAEK